MYDSFDHSDLFLEYSKVYWLDFLPFWDISTESIWFLHLYIYLHCYSCDLVPVDFLPDMFIFLTYVLCSTISLFL